MHTRKHTKSAIMGTKPLLLVLLLISSATLAAEEKVSKEESQKYYSGLMQKAEKVKLTAENAEKYLRGVWRLDKKAHVGGGHYTRSDKGDDVSLICNKGILIQVDFNHNHGKLSQVIEQLAKLKVDANGFIGLGSGRLYKPLDQNHMAVADYDYIVVLQRVSGSAQTPPPDKKNAEKRTNAVEEPEIGTPRDRPGEMLD